MYNTIGSIAPIIPRDPFHAANLVKARLGGWQDAIATRAFARYKIRSAGVGLRSFSALPIR